ncbi:MAG: EamA family transporter [Candidatus Jorgensenbacteria bacterium]|nr:EamA family transporter [Candidatus Jorgensenbacteria bacterium]
MWLLYAFLSALTASLVAIFGKLGLKGIDPTLATTIRSIIMAGFLVLTSLFLKKFNGFSFDSFSSRDWTLIILSGIAGALSWLFYFFALRSVDASKVVAVDRMSIVFVVLLAAIFLGETLGWKSVLGALLMVAGAIMISL